MQSFWALGTSTAFKVKFVILFIYLIFWPLLAIPSKKKFSLFFQRSWNHKKHANILSEITFLEAHTWSINPI